MNNETMCGLRSCGYTGGFELVFGIDLHTFMLYMLGVLIVIAVILKLIVRHRRKSNSLKNWSFDSIKEVEDEDS